MVQITIEATGKGYHPSSRWTFLSSRPETVTVESMAEARRYLRDRYGKAKRMPMYVDADGQTKRVGYVIGYRNADYSHSPVNHWLQQDWISFQEVTDISL